MKVAIVIGVVVLFVAVSAQESSVFAEPTCAQGLYPPPASRKVKDYVIDLETPPLQRWAEVAKDKHTQIKTLIQAFKDFLGKGPIIEEILKILDMSGPELDRLMPKPYGDEIKSFANAGGIELGELVFYNIFYEAFSVCTSIVAHDANGVMYHGRNLDFGLFLGWDKHNDTWEITEMLRPTIINVIWKRGGNTVYKSVHFAGYVGVLTAIAPGRFSLSIDSRFQWDGGWQGIVHKILTGDGAWMGFLTRQTMETAPSYEAAQTMLAKTLMIAPAYFILGGPKAGQGCVITRNREANGTDIWHMSEAGKWYILETNYDHWKAPLFIDNRRGPANKCMQKMTMQNAGLPGIFNVLSSQPVLNQLTTYSALMQVEAGSLETWLQYCPEPCYPF